MQPVGFVGLGLMGGPMAANLLKAGFELSVYNRTADKARAMTDAGARFAPLARDVAVHADQAARWRAGAGLRAEEYLAAFPALRGRAEDQLVLIWGEVLLRAERGEAPEPQEYRHRFPDHAEALTLREALAANTMGAGAARLLQSVFIGVSVLNPVTYLAVAAAETIIVVVACIGPAMKAARVDPLSALRSE